jgi:hypothetical protein
MLFIHVNMFLYILILYRPDIQKSICPSLLHNCMFISISISISSLSLQLRHTECQRLPGSTKPNLRSMSTRGHQTQLATNVRSYRQSRPRPPSPHYAAHVTQSPSITPKRSPPPVRGRNPLKKNLIPSGYKPKKEHRQANTSSKLFPLTLSLYF